jgi:hypothetical protein
MALTGLVLGAGKAIAQSDTARVRIRFTAPGDDGQTGRAAAYDVRYSDLPITQGNWDQAAPVPDILPPPNVAGTTEIVTVSIPNALLGNRYHVALKTRDEAFNWSLVSNSASFDYSFGTGTGEDPILPDEIVLEPSYPNPFNGSTRIEFQIPSQARVKITIWNSLGQRIQDVAEAVFDPGRHDVLWDGTDRFGSAVASGTYFYQLTSGTFSTSRKMTYLK